MTPKFTKMISHLELNKFGISSKIKVSSLAMPLTLARVIYSGKTLRPLNMWTTKLQTMKGLQSPATHTIMIPSEALMTGKGPFLTFADASIRKILSNIP